MLEASGAVAEAAGESPYTRREDRIPSYGADRPEPSAKEKAEWAHNGRPGSGMGQEDEQYLQ